MNKIYLIYLIDKIYLIYLIDFKLKIKNFMSIIKLKNETFNQLKMTKVRKPERN